MARTCVKRETARQIGSRYLSYQELPMPIHATHAQHVKNAAFAAYMNAQSKIIGDGRPTLTADGLDAFELRNSGELDRRQSSVATLADYLTTVHNLKYVERPPAMSLLDWGVLTAGKTTDAVQNFFAMNVSQAAVPKIYFIRHKQGSRLKRVEFCLLDTSTDVVKPVAILWKDQGY
jgi:hypothetical protein